MIIELPKEISFDKKYTNQELYIENGILRFTRNISFRKFMKETRLSVVLKVLLSLMKIS